MAARTVALVRALPMVARTPMATMAAPTVVPMAARTVALLRARPMVARTPMATMAAPTVVPMAAPTRRRSDDVP